MFRPMERAALPEARDGSRGSPAALVVTVAPGTTAADPPRIVGVSDAFCAAFGYAATDLVGKPFTFINGNPEAMRRFGEAVLDGAPLDGANVSYQRDGHPLWLEWHLHPVNDAERGVLGQIDASVAERRRPADGDLRSLIMALEHASDAIAIYELRDGHDKPRVQYANRAAELQSGYSRKELEHASRLGPLTDKASMHAMLESMRNGEPLRTRQRLYRPDGSAYWADINLRPLLEATPGVWRWIAIERDVTEEVEREGLMAAELEAYATLASAAETFLDSHDKERLEKTYLTARQRLIAAARREAAQVLDSMYESALRRLTLYEESIERRNETAAQQAHQADVMALLAHDIRGPLNTIVGFTELVAESCPEQADVQEYARLVIRAANRVVDLTNEVIVAAQLDRNEYKPAVERFDLLSLVQSVVSLLPGGERVTFDFPEEEIDVDSDMAGIRHIVSNLTSNALKYSDVSTLVDLVVRRSDDAVRIEFRDRGMGIPPDEHTAVFDRFSRASNARASKVRGTGLGLYFVKQLVERGNGNISLDSKVDVGTAVSVTLPLRAVVNIDRAVIVTIESSTDDRSLIASELRKRGHLVRVVQTAASAEAGLRREQVGLVILDVDVFNPEDLATIWSVCRERDVRVMTAGAHSDQADPLQLRKPFVADDLIQKVEAVCPLVTV
jgi:PAS domain S-box-containing protein